MILFFSYGWEHTSLAAGDAEHPNEKAGPMCLYLVSGFLCCGQKYHITRNTIFKRLEGFPWIFAGVVCANKNFSKGQALGEVLEIEVIARINAGSNSADL